MSTNPEQPQPKKTLATRKVRPAAPPPAATTTEGDAAPPAAAAPTAPVPAQSPAPRATPAPKPRNAHQPLERLPPFRVLLHNDNHNDVMFVVRSIVELTPLNAPIARDVMLTAHEAGVAQILITHQERAELYQEQFASKGLIVTIEPAE